MADKKMDYKAFIDVEMQPVIKDCTILGPSEITIGKSGLVIENCKIEGAVSISIGKDKSHGG